MIQRKGSRGEATRDAIVNAAENLFAQHGFDGARVDAIAEASGHNKTLIFRYFGDKLGLYAEVIRRKDEEMGLLMAGLFAPLVGDDAIASNHQQFKHFLWTVFGAIFDYMVAHPNLPRMIHWEHAENWETLGKIASHIQPSDLSRFETTFRKAQAAGLLRSGIDIDLAVLLSLQACWSIPTTLPLFQKMENAGELSVDACRQIRDQTLTFIVAGILADANE